MKTKTDLAFQRCVMPDCAATYDVGEVRTSCDACGSLARRRLRLGLAAAFPRRCGVRGQVEPPQRAAVLQRRVAILRAAAVRAADKIVTIGEGQTLLHSSDGVARFVGVQPGNLLLQYEGMNPSGSFKDNGMTAAFTHAHTIGARRAACASTGNTSASLALYCGVSKLMQAIIFIGSGKISYGKLSQALDYGALTIQIAGDFDDAMLRVQQVSTKQGIYLVNSVNPFRLEGQKTIMFRVLEALRWQVPDWIVVPGGNLGNSSAFGKAFHELHELGLIDRMPRLAVINAAGANTLYELYERRGLRWNGGRPDASIINNYYAELDNASRRASTIASAIEINRPVNLSQVPAGARMLRRRRARSDRRANARRQGPSRRERPRLRAGQRGQRRRRQAAPRGRRHRAQRARRLHSHRPSVEGSDGHGRLSHARSGRVQPRARQPRRQPRGVRQSGRAGREQPGRNHSGD